MYTLYGNKISGNSYKTKLTCELLGIRYHWCEIDLLAQEHRQASYLTINPLGQVPALVVKSNVDSGIKSSTSSVSTQPQVILESNAIMRYLAEDSYLIPTDRIRYAQMWQWLLYEQNEVRTNIASVRFIKKFQNMMPSRLEEYEIKFKQSQTILHHLDQQLATRDFILGNMVSLADISLYVYTHLAEDGGLSLTAYDNLRAWFQRIEELPRFVAM